MRFTKALTTVLATLICSHSSAFIGQTVDDVKAVYGEPESVTVFPNGTYYTFTNYTTSLSFRPINGKILDIRLEYTGEDRQGFLNNNLGDINADWSTQTISSAELSIFSFDQKQPDCIKLRNNTK
jgi:hypothetical protein